MRPSLCRSSVLPLPFAFSRLGVVPGLIIMMAVAVGNALAGTLLLRAASALDKHSFESIAEAVGGRSWRVSALHRVRMVALRQSGAWCRCAWHLARIDACCRSALVSMPP